MSSRRPPLRWPAGLFACLAARLPARQTALRPARLFAAMALSEYASLPRYCVLPKDGIAPRKDDYLIWTLPSRHRRGQGAGGGRRPRSLLLSTFFSIEDDVQFQEYVRSSDRYEMRAESPHALYGQPPRGGYSEERARTPSEHDFVQRSDISSDSMEPPTGLDALRNFERQQVKLSFSAISPRPRV